LFVAITRDRAAQALPGRETTQMGVVVISLHWSLLSWDGSKNIYGFPADFPDLR
jgi:hypothetical protein